MKIATFATLLSLTAGAAFAEPTCITPAEGAGAPVWKAIQSFEEEGGVVRSFKINDGACYEIYGTLKGTNMEVFFDPTTGVELDRIDA